jgi:hypothetical protein
MRLLSVTAAALLAASCGLANAQATNMSRSPGDARSLSNSDTDTRDYRTYRRGARQYYRSGWNEPGWNSYGAGVQIGPFGVGIGVGASPEYNYGWPDYRYGPSADFYGPPHRY